MPEDYGELDNGLIFQFRRSIKSDNTEIEARRRSALDKNFMRFGRGDKDLAEKEKKLHSKVEEFTRKSRDNKNFMRFGRDKEFSSSSEEEKSDLLDKPTDKRDVTNGETMEETNDQDKPQHIIYYRRDMPKNLMRFGRSNNFLRFGRANNKGNLMRFGRSEAFGFPRNSKMDRNFMRLGRSGFEKSAHKNKFIEELLQEDETNNDKLKDILNYDTLLDSVYDKV